MDWYTPLRRQLFKLDAERSHNLALAGLSRLGRSPLHSLLTQQVAAKPVQCLGLTFPNPVGLAAGLDKNASCIDAFGAMGFGFVEVGTVTPRPQPGNAKPRMFRLPEHQAIINRMGFNNKGVDNLVAEVKRSRYQGILGINIGKNKDTPEAQAVNDYTTCMEKVYSLADYVTINISSPNTPGLRALQHGEQLKRLLGDLKEQQSRLAKTHQRYVPVVVKIAPDLNRDDVGELAETFTQHEIDGVIATNTTLERGSVKGHHFADEAGGLSGKPVEDASTQVIRWLKKDLAEDMPIIGVGGIDSAASARQKLEAGATLIQIYTGFIYQGPRLISDIVNSL